MLINPFSPILEVRDGRYELTTLPICYQCNKRVSRVVVDRQGYKLYFMVACHGQYEASEVDVAWLLNWIREVKVGHAFGPESKVVKDAAGWPR